MRPLISEEERSLRGDEDDERDWRGGVRVLRLLKTVSDSMSRRVSDAAKG